MMTLEARRSGWSRGLQLAANPDRVQVKAAGFGRETAIDGHICGIPLLLTSIRDGQRHWLEEGDNDGRWRQISSTLVRKTTPGRWMSGSGQIRVDSACRRLDDRSDNRGLDPTGS